MSRTFPTFSTSESRAPIGTQASARCMDILKAEYNEALRTNAPFRVLHARAMALLAMWKEVRHDPTR